MRHALMGVLGGLVLAGVGVFWLQGRAAIETGAPPPPAATPAPDPMKLPLADPGSMTGPSPPEMSDLSREEQRFFRYDRNRDRMITRDEMLSTRTDGFRALDKDGDGRLTPREFAATAPKPVTKKPACKC